MERCGTLRMAWRRIGSILAVLGLCFGYDDVELITRHRLAVEMSVAGDLDGALHSLRSIVDQNPTAQYVSDLGVTYLRKGELLMAKESFLRALTLDPEYELAKINLQEAEHYLHSISSKTIPTDLISQERRKQEHRLMCLPRHSLQKLFHEKEKHTLMKILQRPFFIRANQSIKKVRQRILERQRQFSFKNLSSLFGSIIADYYPHNMGSADVHPHLIPLEAGLRRLLEDSDTAQYLQWNLPHPSYQQLIALGKIAIPPALDDSHWLPLCLNETIISSFFLKTHWKMLLVGVTGAGMFNHQDTLRTGSWQIQISGRKQWHLCSSSQSPLLYDAGVVDTLSPDYSRYPLFRRASCYQETLSPGDMIYYPKDYWHQTHSLDTPTISLSSSVISQENFQEVIEELTKECHGRGIIFTPSAEMCHSLEKCYDLWHHMFR